jgi:hypothetical protein
MLRLLPQWRRIGEVLLALLALIWAGMVIGVSGLATPVKFSAPLLSLPVALDIGRVTFHLFSRFEWGFAAALLLIGLTIRVPRLRRLPIAVVAALVVLQTTWLLPALNAHVAIVIAGGAPRLGAYHVWYIAAEAVKLAALLAIGVGVVLKSSNSFAR